MLCATVMCGRRGALYADSNASHVVLCLADRQMHCMADCTGRATSVDRPSSPTINQATTSLTELSAAHSASADRHQQESTRLLVARDRLSVSLSLCRPTVRTGITSPTSPNCLYRPMLPVARPFSGGVIIRYVLPVLWVTSSPGNLYATLPRHWQKPGV